MSDYGQGCWSPFTLQQQVDWSWLVLVFKGGAARTALVRIDSCCQNLTATARLHTQRAVTLSLTTKYEKLKYFDRNVKSDQNQSTTLLYKQIHLFSVEKKWFWGVFTQREIYSEIRWHKAWFMSQAHLYYVVGHGFGVARIPSESNACCCSFCHHRCPWSLRQSWERNERDLWKNTDLL